MTVIRGGSMLYAISVALFKRVNAALSATSIEVYDGFIPEELESVDFPYVVIGEMDETAVNMLARAARETVVTIKVYTNYRGTKQAKQIGDLIAATLDETDLAPEEGWEFPKIRFLDANILQEDDVRFTNMLRFEIKAERQAVAT